MNFKPLPVLAGSLVCLLVGGCITHEETVYRDVSRNQVEFESDAAGRIFYEALSKLPPTGRKQESKTLEIPLVFKTDTRVVRGENELFNRAISECDTNRDGKISEKEARIFAERQEHH